MGVSQFDVEAIDGLQLPADARLAHLANATWTLQRERGFIGDDLLGLSREELYEVVAIIGLKTITNYINHIAGTEIDPPFRAQARRAHRKAASREPGRIEITPTEQAIGGAVLKPFHPHD